MKDAPVNLRKTGRYVIEVKMCNSKVACLSFIIRTSFQRTDSLKWFNRARNSILRVCLLICQGILKGKQRRCGTGTEDDKRAQ